MGRQLNGLRQFNNNIAVRLLSYNKGYGVIVKHVGMTTALTLIQILPQTISSVINIGQQYGIYYPVLPS